MALPITVVDLIAWLHSAIHFQAHLKGVPPPHGPHQGLLGVTYAVSLRVKAEDEMELPARSKALEEKPGSFDLVARR